MGNVSFGKWLVAGIALVTFFWILEGFDQRIAMSLAVLTLLALFLRYPQASRQIQAILTGGN